MPIVAVFLTTAAGTAWPAAAAGGVPLPPTKGDFGRVAVPFATAFKKGDEVRPIWEGVVVLDGGLLGRLIVGLSHEEKKSSSPPAASGSSSAAPSMSVR